MFFPCREMMHKTGCMSVRDKKRQTLTLKAYSVSEVHHQISQLPSASISTPTIHGMTFLDFPLNCIAFISEVRPAQYLLSGMEEYNSFSPTLDQTCLHSDLSQLVEYLTSNPNSLITACKAVVATWQDRRSAKRFRCGSWPVWELLSEWTLALPDATTLPSLLRT